MIYNSIKRLVVAGRYEANDLRGKLDILIANNRITLEQYNELSLLISNKEGE